MSTIQLLIGIDLWLSRIISKYFVIIYKRYFLLPLYMRKNIPDYQKIAVCRCFYLQYKRIIHMILCQFCINSVQFCTKLSDILFRSCYLSSAFSAGADCFCAIFILDTQNDIW